MFDRSKYKELGYISPDWPLYNNQKLQDLIVEYAGDCFNLEKVVHTECFKFVEYNDCEDKCLKAIQKIADKENKRIKKELKEFI